MEKKVNVIVATHKKFKIFKSNIYTPIQVGASLTNLRFGYLTDNINENISFKNKNYCELTALYWMWKNNNDYIKGICHYRRYLSIKNIDINSKYFINEDIIKKDLEIYDIIVPKKTILKKINCKENYLLGEGVEKDLVNLKEVIKNIYPKYEKSYVDILEGNKCSYCNVMIAKKEVFDNYCKWLFDILFELEKVTDLSEYTQAQARIYGYLSEILLNVWINKNCLKVKEYKLINTEVEKNIKYYTKLFIERIGMYNLAIYIKNLF